MVAVAVVVVVVVAVVVGVTLGLGVVVAVVVVVGVAVAVVVAVAVGVVVGLAVVVVMSDSLLHRISAEKQLWQSRAIRAERLLRELWRESGPQAANPNSELHAALGAFLVSRDRQMRRPSKKLSAPAVTMRSRCEDLIVWLSDPEEEPPEWMNDGLARLWRQQSVDAQVDAGSLVDTFVKGLLDE